MDKHARADLGHLVLSEFQRSLRFWTLYASRVQRILPCSQHLTAFALALAAFLPGHRRLPEDTPSTRGRAARDGGRNLEDEAQGCDHVDCDIPDV